MKQKQSLVAITAVLAILTAVGPISTDMYLPAFGAMSDALGYGAGGTQMTLAAWFFGLSIGQVTWGAYADHYGRRGPLLLGTSIYTLASVGCALAGDMVLFSIFRLLAAFGAAASLVIPRAVIRDVVGTDGDAARMLGRMVLVMSIVPMMAPTLGGLIVQHWDWRGIFWMASLYGVFCLWLVQRALPDTLTPALHVRFAFGRALTGYVVVMTERVFVLHALEGGFATFSLFAFLGGAPMVFLSGYHLSPTLFGSVFVLNAVGYALGTNVNGRMVPRYGASRVLSGAVTALVIVTLLMVVAAWFGLGGVWAQVCGITLCMMVLGFLLPGAALGSVLPNKGAAASASALYGTVVFFIGAVSTVVVGRIDTPGPLPMTVLMLVGALAALTCDRVRRRR